MILFDAQKYPYPSQRHVVYGMNGMAASSHPLSTQAGMEVLQKGGNAIDAALAMAAAIAIADPASNGPGGDCFAIVWYKGKMYGLNSSGFSPALLTPEHAEGNRKLPKRGWLPVTVPGAAAGWAALNKRFGTKPMAELFAPAVKLSKAYPLSPDGARYINLSDKNLHAEQLPILQEWFRAYNPQNREFHAGEIVDWSALGDTLQDIAETNGQSMYTGRLARLIDEHARKTGGLLRYEDLAAFEPEWVEPVSSNYKGVDVWELPPNNQGCTALIALNILENLQLQSRDDVETLHMQMEAIKLAFADSLGYFADTRFENVPLHGLLDKQYAAQRAALVTPNAQEFCKGTPPKGGTVYFCAADGEGNMISMIQSLYMAFGSGVVVPGTGMALQNRGECFVSTEGHPNRIAGHKRPYHTIMPGFLTQNGKALGPFGIMGGYMQPQAHVQVLMNMVDFGLNPQSALDAPRFCWSEGLKFSMESAFDPATVEALRAKGHQIEVKDGTLYGRGQIILRQENGVYCGASEPRADGMVSAF